MSSFYDMMYEDGFDDPEDYLDHLEDTYMRDDDYNDDYDDVIYDDDFYD